jgi:hypothetical protein
MRNHGGVLVVTIGVALVLMAVAPAAARAPAACEADAEKLCKGVQPGGGRLLGCLRSHTSDLSPGCKETLKALKQGASQRWVEASRAWAAACSGDIQALCKDIPAGAGRIAECLREHQASLSPGCKAAFLPSQRK